MHQRKTRTLCRVIAATKAATGNSAHASSQTVSEEFPLLSFCQVDEVTEMVAVRMGHQNRLGWYRAKSLFPAGVAGFLVRNGSINRCVPPGDTTSKTACPSQVIEIVLISLGDGACASAAPAIAKATGTQSDHRIPELFIPVRSSVGSSRRRLDIHHGRSVERFNRSDS